MNRLLLPLFLVLIGCLLVVAPNAQASRHHSDSSGNSTAPPPIPPPLSQCQGNEQPDSNGNCPTNPPPQQTFLCPDGFTTVTDLSQCPSNPPPSSSGSSSSSHSGSHSSSHSTSTKMNMTEAITTCFSNAMGNQSSGNVSATMAMTDLDNCFMQLKTHHTISTIHIPGLTTTTKILQGQVLLTQKKSLTTNTHTTYYYIGYNQGVSDGKIGGPGEDGPGHCQSEQGINVNDKAQVNACLQGYFAGWNHACPTSKYGCKD